MSIKKSSAKAETKQDVKVEDHAIEVTRAKELQNCIMFDAKVNGITIYGMSYRELQRKDGSGSFVKIGFPSRKGSDGQYYNECYFRTTDADIEAIEKGIEAVL